MNDYPLIADHGLIGDLQSAALIARDGTIDWFCTPRFDSPSLFGALLDHARGGHLRTRPSDGPFDTKQLYLPDTAVLITRFLTESGVGELVDFMLIAGPRASANRRLVRMLRCVRGTMTFEVEVAPRFDYGRQRHELIVYDSGAVFRTETNNVTLNAVRAPGDERTARRGGSDGGDLHVSLTLTAGQVRGLLLETDAESPPSDVLPTEIEQYFDDTVRFWRGWSAKSTYVGRWREEMLRSAITLKLMTYAPSGGLVAAPTVGLPEQIGGERNWDYRYTWVRDASFSVQALLGMGFVEEAASFGRWLRDRVQERCGSGEGPLDVMYRVDGSSDLREEILENWDGYRWRLLETTGWPDNQSCRNLLAWSWDGGNGPNRHVIVVNLSNSPSQARVHLDWPCSSGQIWWLTELLTGAEFQRDGDELDELGLFVALGPWEFHVLGAAK